MISVLIGGTIVLAIVLPVIVLLFLEFVVEPAIELRKRLVKKVGAIKVCILLIIVLVILDLWLTSVIASWNDSEIYKYAKLAVLVYFLPRQGEIEKKKDDSKQTSLK